MKMDKKTAIHEDGQQIYKKMLNTTNYRAKVNKSQNDISLHP
jgi:hypothetical protein